MIAAMAAMVSAASTLRLVSPPAGLSGKLALVEDTGPLDEVGIGTGAGACAGGPLKATGCAKPDGESHDRNRRTAHGRVLAAYRVGPKCRQPQKNEYCPAPHGLHSTASRKTAQAVSRALYTFNSLQTVAVTGGSRKRFNCSLDDAQEGSFPTPETVAMPVTDDLKLTPLAVLAVNSLMDTCKRLGPDAFDDDALILLLAVGSIIARTRRPEGLHDAMEALRLAVEMDGIDRPGLSPSIN
jgi:hypothetical protein